MAQLAPMMQLRARFEDKCGHPLAGGSVFAFEVGTSTPKATYADADGTIPNTHPIKLDYRGEADIYLLSGRYRFVVYSCYGVKIYDVDDVGEWLGVITADRVIDGDKTQKQINEEQNERKSVKLWATSLVDALSKYNSVDFDEDENINAPVALMSGQNITSNNHELNQASPTTIAIESDYSAADTIISGLHIVQDKTGPISGGTNNNHASIKYRGGLRNIVKNIVIDGQLGISFGTGQASSTERRSMFNRAENITMLNTHMGVEHIGAAYNHTRDIVIASTQFRGIFHGIRLTGYDKIENPDETAHAPCHGNTGSDYFVKNMTNGISAQNSAKYNSYDRIFITECDRAVQLVQGTVVGNNPTMNHFDVIGEKIGQAIVNQGGNHNDFEILIDGGAFTDQGIQELTGYSGKGFNRYRGIIKNSAKTGAQFRYSHNLYALQVSSAMGNGVNINGSYGNGSITVSGATGTGVVLAGNYNNLQVVATECLNALVVSGSGNTINIQTDGNVQISGSGNTIIGRIGGNLTVTGNENKFIGDVTGTVTRTGTTGNDFTGLKGWSDNIVLSGQTTDGSGRVTVAVPKHTSAQIRNIYATIPTNTSEWSLKVISISGGNVMFELQDNSGNAVPSTAVAFNYTYSCS
ncbi:phage tail fiber protein [Acinetobacter baumannii]